MTFPSYAHETKIKHSQDIKKNITRISNKIKEIDKICSNQTQISEFSYIILKNINTELTMVSKFLKTQKGNNTKKEVNKKQEQISNAHKIPESYNKSSIRTVENIDRNMFQNKSNNINIKLSTYEEQINKLNRLFKIYQNSSVKKEHDQNLNTIYSLLQKMQTQKNTLNSQYMVNQKQINKLTNLNHRFNNLFFKIKKNLPC